MNGLDGVNMEMNGKGKADDARAGKAGAGAMGGPGSLKGQNAENALIPLLFFAAIGVAVVIGIVLTPEGPSLKDCGKDFACFGNALGSCEPVKYQFRDDNLVVIASIVNSSARSAGRCSVNVKLKDYDCPMGIDYKECQAIGAMRAVALKMDMDCWLDQDTAQALNDGGHIATSVSFLNTCHGDLAEYVPILTANRLH
jgi:hypothetical protein